MFKSNRYFKLWDCRVSHNQVLIRSPSTPDIPTNIDFVLWGVEYISLPTSLDGLEIIRGESIQAVGLEFSPSVNGEVFIIITAGIKYIIVASGCKVLENDLDIFESSLEGFSATNQSRNLGKVLAHS